MKTISNLFSVFFILLVASIYCDNDKMYDENNEDPKIIDTESHNDKEAKSQNDNGTDLRKTSNQDFFEQYGLDKSDYTNGQLTREQMEEALAQTPEYKDKDFRNLSEAQLKQIIDSKQSPEQNQTFRVNKQDLSEAQVIENIKKEYKVDVPTDPEARTQFLKDYVAVKNLEEGNKAVNAKAQVNAEVRKANEQLRNELLAKQEELDRIEDEIKANKEIVETDVSAIYDDEKRNDMKMDQRIANIELKKLEEQKAKLETSADEIKNEAIYNYHVVLISELQTQIPELATEKSVEDILYNFDQGKMIASVEEIARAEAIIEIINDYNAIYKGVKEKPSIQQYYAVKKSKYQVPAVAQSAGNQGDKPKFKTFAEILKEKQANFKSEPDATSSKNFTERSKSDGNVILSGLGF